MAELTLVELTELSKIEFVSELFGKIMTIKDFAENISTLNDDNFSKKKNAFSCDLGNIMGIFIKKGCFSEHDFKTAEKVFFGICNLNLSTEQEC